MDLDPAGCERLHNRNINITTYAYQDDGILLEGRLTDERFHTTYNFMGESRPPGIVHDMVIRLLVRGPKLAIEAVAAEMLTVPNPECRDAGTSLRPLIGESITTGFTAKVHRLVGGAKGCAHLVALSRAMASAAIQGAWVAIARLPRMDSRYAKRSLRSVLGTCHLWRTEGPLAKKVQAHLDAAAQEKP
ncbi:MAG: DUF2889 domain-containing protein [Desulfobacterales bacterium]|nr:DUF2889 domain-containing protein [Desulfobacterales bacterium]